MKIMKLNTERTTSLMHSSKERLIIEDDRKAIKEIKVHVYSLEQFNNLPKTRKENGRVYHKSPMIYLLNYNGQEIYYARYMRK